MSDMQIFHAIILSVIEGVTEFLPVSSTGHLILSSHILGVLDSEFAKTFEIFIQLGAILAVLTLYARRLLVSPAVWMRVVVGFVPTGIIGLAVYKLVKHYLLGNPWVVVWSLLIGGIFILAVESFYSEKQATIHSIEQLSLTSAALLGLCQAVAIIPGVSRAAATVFGGLGLKMTRKAAVEFSFLLAIPTMAAASGLDLLKSAGGFSVNEFGLLVVGFMGAFITAFFSVKALVRFIEHHSFRIFGFYRIVVAGLFWMLLAR